MSAGYTPLGEHAFAIVCQVVLLLRHPTVGYAIFLTVSRSSWLCKGTIPPGDGTTLGTTLHILLRGLIEHWMQERLLLKSLTAEYANSLLARMS